MNFIPVFRMITFFILVMSSSFGKDLSTILPKDDFRTPFGSKIQYKIEIKSVKDLYIKRYNYYRFPDLKIYKDKNFNEVVGYIKRKSDDETVYSDKDLFEKNLKSFLVLESMKLDLQFYRDRQSLHEFYYLGSEYIKTEGTIFDKFLNLSNSELTIGFDSIKGDVGTISINNKSYYMNLSNLPKGEIYRPTVDLLKKHLGQKYFDQLNLKLISFRKVLSSNDRLKIMSYLKNNKLICVKQVENFQKCLDLFETSIFKSGDERMKKSISFLLALTSFDVYQPELLNNNFGRRIKDRLKVKSRLDQKKEKYIKYSSTKTYGDRALVLDDRSLQTYISPFRSLFLESDSKIKNTYKVFNDSSVGREKPVNLILYVNDSGIDFKLNFNKRHF